MYLTYDSSYWACDIEADGFVDTVSKIWCVCVENVVTGEKHAFVDKESFLQWYRGIPVHSRFVGHNFIAYDMVVLNRLWGVGLGISRVVDTFVLSQLYSPNFAGGHSLEAWGTRLKHPKTEHNDFSKFSPEMVTYCENDTALTALLFRRLTARMVSLGFSEEGAQIEHQSWNIIQNKQRRHGFPFDIQAAHLLYVSLREREDELAREIHKLFPPRLLLVKECKQAFRKDGTRTALYQQHVSRYPKVEVNPEGGFRSYDYVSFNIGSPKQRIDKLLELGWTPTEWNTRLVVLPNGRKLREKTSPRVNEETLLDFAEESGIPEIASIAKWLVVNSRANMVRTWMDAYNDETGAIHGRLFLAGTLRYRHSSPNSANIPAVKTEKVEQPDGTKVDTILLGERGTWAYECRSLFTAGDTSRYSLVGVDAKGIQIRILLNYAYSDEAVGLYMADGVDPHVLNAKALGLANKPAAKKAFYTILMGGQGARIAADQAQFGTKLTAEEGNELRQQIIDTIPGFQDLIDRLQSELERTGRIRLCDGTPIIVPSPHMVIPYLLQGDESRIMKKASIALDQEIRKAKLDAQKVADIHDEWQYVCANGDTEQFIPMALSVFPPTGRGFNYKVPIEGDAKVGKTWAETH